MKKKLIALLLAAAMVLSLAACGSPKAPADSPSGNGTSADAPAPATDPAAPGEYPVIRWAYTALFDTPDEPLVEAAMNEILRETCGAEIDLVRIDFGNMQQQFNLLLTGGSDSIDVFSSFWYMPLNTLYSNGQLADMTEPDT